MKEVIAYSLVPVESIGGYLPQAFIVQENDLGELEYMVARALHSNVASYGINVAGSPHDELLKLCDQLSMETLEEKYGKNGRKKRSLSQLYEDQKMVHLIRQYLSRKMGRFLQLVMEHRLPLCLEIERKTRLQQIRILHTGEDLKPVLSFKKTQTGIHYQIQLKKGAAAIIPCRHDTHIVLDDPAYVIIDYCLFSLAEINANKLKPFRKKDTIFIPDRITKTYFEKFIMDVVAQVDIEAEGFEVIREGHLQTGELSVVKDFMEDAYLLQLTFDYGRSKFQYAEPAEKRTRLEMGDAGQVTIYQVNRDRAKEEVWVQKLVKAGLLTNSSRRFTINDNKGKALLYWLYQNKASISKTGLDLRLPVVDGKKLKVERGVIRMDTHKENDWFDIGGKLVIGDFSIPFAELMNHIKEKDFYFPLPDGTFFLIPEEWMSKYEYLAKFGEQKNGKFRVAKNNFTIVEELENESSAGISYLLEKQEIDYPKDDHLKATLRPYQLEGVKWMITHQINRLGACLADDMGLGKTLQTLAVLSYTKNHLKKEVPTGRKSQQMTLFEQTRINELNPLKALVVLPASLVFNWYHEVKKFTPGFHVCQYIGPGRKKMHSQLDKFDVILTTYQTALRDIEVLRGIIWEYVVLDESQMIKNRESKVFKALHSLDAKNRLSLSGTPIENSLADLWSQMQFINPDILGSYAFFKETFQWPVEKQKDESALQQLKSMVDPFILRRTKEEVAKDLPSLTEQLHYVEMSVEQKKIFESEKSAARNYLLEMGDTDPQYKFHVFRALLRLRQIANHPRLMDESYQKGSGKYDMVLEQLETIIKSGHKVLVFSSFKSHLQLYTSHLQANKIRFCLLTGDSSQADRKRQVTLFQENPDYQVFFISIKAGGTGLNLTAADYVFILDPWWNPFVEEQAISRAHRIGQDKPVTVIKFVSRDSIEEKIIRLQERKKDLSDQLLGTGEHLTLDREEVAFLLG